MAETHLPLRTIAVGADTEPEALAAYLDKRHRTRTALVSAADGDILVVEDV